MGKPVLGICLGIQSINVYFGGKLHQDIPGHKEPGRDIRHMVTLARGSRLKEIMGIDRMAVNSYHHQAIKAVAPELYASAVSDDGVVEAIELPGEKFVVGVQWHPERMQEEDSSRRLFEAFYKKMLMLKRLFILLSALLLFSSCASHENNSYLHLRLTDDPTTLDPAYIVDVPGGQVAAKIFDGLVSYDDKARIIPGLASSWSVSPDGQDVHLQHPPRREILKRQGSDFRRLQIHLRARPVAENELAPHLAVRQDKRGEAVHGRQERGGGRHQMPGLPHACHRAVASRSGLSWGCSPCPAHTSCRRKLWRNTGSISPTIRWARGLIRFLNGTTEAA